MKKRFKVLLCAFSIVLLGGFAIGQTQVLYSLEHGTDYPSTADGCTMVQFEVVYNSGGTEGSAYSSWLQLDQGVGVSVAVNIPSGATIVSKKVNFSFTLSSNTYTYTIIDGSNWVDNMFVECNCPPVKSKVLSIQEVYHKANKKVIYHLTSPLQGDC